MLHVQEYLKDHTYEQLEEDYGIMVSEYDDRISLNYHQIDSYKHRFEPIVMECRCLILSKPDHEILCRSFDRFWNYGEDPRSDEFDITKSTVDDKVDGSLMPVYHDGAKWRVATRKMAFAEGLIPNKKKTYAEIFEEAIGGDVNDIFADVDKDLVTIFEMVSPETRIVTPYKDKAVYLLDVRNRKTGDFLGNNVTYYWSIPIEAGWRYPNRHEFETWKDVIRASEDLPAMEEGYVAVIGDWRIKIKNPAYLAIAHLRDNGAITEKRVVKLIFMQDHDEYLIHFPEDRPEFDPYIKAYDQMIDEVNSIYPAVASIEDQKEFALKIKDCKCKGVLFAMRKGKKLTEILDDFLDNYKVRLLKEYIK